MRSKKEWLDGLLCRIGWHRRIGVTVGNFIRCYACGQNLHYDGVWRNEMPSDLRPLHIAEADELRRVLDDITTALWNSESPLLNTHAYEAAMVALGYRLESGHWTRP